MHGAILCKVGWWVLLIGVCKTPVLRLRNTMMMMMMMMMITFRVDMNGVGPLA